MDTMTAKDRPKLQGTLERKKIQCIQIKYYFSSFRQHTLASKQQKMSNVQCEYLRLSL